MSEQQMTEEMREEICPEAEGSVAEQPTSADEDAIARLSRELSELRALIETRQSEQSAPPAPKADVSDEFRRLYPDVAEGDVPDEVWESARGGIPLEAAYALWERRQQVRRADAETANRKNATEAWGRTDAAAEQYFTPDEVRSMSEREVRKHYSRILESMKHWN